MLPSFNGLKNVLRFYGAIPRHVCLSVPDVQVP